MSQAWVRHQERGTVFGMKVIARIALVLGRPAARLLLYPICLYFIVFSRGGRRASREFLSLALGRPARVRDVFRHHHAFAATLLDRTFLLTGRQDRLRLVAHGIDRLQAILARGRGCLLLGAHLGSFDVVRALASRGSGPVVNMMMYEENAKKLNAVIAALGGRHSMNVIPIGDIDTLLRAQECVSRGEIVAVLGDRVFGSEKTVQTTFLGQPVVLPAGPYLVARSLCVPVVLFFGLYGGDDRYDVYFEPFADEIDVDRRCPRPDLERWAQRYVARLEHYCRLAPYNWFNFFPYWESGAADPQAAPETRVA